MPNPNQPDIPLPPGDYFVTKASFAWADSMYLTSITSLWYVDEQDALIANRFSQ